jgi:hypothetical protein
VYGRKQNGSENWVAHFRVSLHIAPGGIVYRSRTAGNYRCYWRPIESGADSCGPIEAGRPGHGSLHWPFSTVYLWSRAMLIAIGARIRAEVLVASRHPGSSGAQHVALSPEPEWPTALATNRGGHDSLRARPRLFALACVQNATSRERRIARVAVRYLIARANGCVHVVTRGGSQLAY